MLNKETVNLFNSDDVKYHNIFIIIIYKFS